MWLLAQHPTLRVRAVEYPFKALIDWCDAGSSLVIPHVERSSDPKSLPKGLPACPPCLLSVTVRDAIKMYFQI
jgi:hypothetical protein